MAYVENPIIEGKDFGSVAKDVNGNFDNFKYVTETVFGMYVGNGETERFIELGFTPIAVEVHRSDGAQGHNVNNYYAMSDIAGGLALNGYRCESRGKAIEVVEDGFNVFFNDPNSGSDYTNYGVTNSNGSIYYFKAYKSICHTPSILEIK